MSPSGGPHRAEKGVAMFDHVALNVSNPNKSREFYEHALKPMGLESPAPSRTGRVREG